MTKQTTILVIEDDEAIQHSLKWLLEEEGYCVQQAAHGAEGINYLQNNSAPELIILDLTMPIMNGFEFLEYQKETKLCLHTPTIVMSANKNLESKINQMGSYYIAKPLAIERLLGLIGELT